MIAIKSLTKEQKSQWLLLWQAYLNFYQSELTQTVTDTTWQRIIDDTSPIYGFGAWQGDCLVGLVHVVLHPNTWNDTDCCYLEDLFVSETVRGQGIGRKLIESVYAFAQAKNCNRVYWVTQVSNVTAQKLYDRLATKTDFIQYRHTI